MIVLCLIIGFSKGCRIVSSAECKSVTSAHFRGIELPVAIVIWLNPTASAVGIVVAVGRRVHVSPMVAPMKERHVHAAVSIRAEVMSVRRIKEQWMPLICISIIFTVAVLFTFRTWMIQRRSMIHFKAKVLMMAVFSASTAHVAYVMRRFIKLQW